MDGGAGGGGAWKVNHAVWMGVERGEKGANTVALWERTSEGDRNKYLARNSSAGM